MEQPVKFTVNDLIGLKYAHKLFLLITGNIERNLQHDELYQKIDYQIQLELAKGDKEFTDPEKARKFARELENLFNQRVDNISTHFTIQKDMIKLQGQTIEEMKKSH